MSPTQPITSVHIQGFQSLHSVDIDLGPYTVIVGPSSSGKSAFIRALHALHHNVRGTSFITQTNGNPFKRATIEAVLSDGTSVTLSRASSPSSKDNAYFLAASDGTQGDPEPIVFTKLNGEVPDEIRDLLPAVPGLTFASQFDKPYLLDASPSEVARTLASLTNVHVILQAAREANRRRLQASQTLKTRQQDLAEIEARTEEFRALMARRDAQTRAAALTLDATTLDDRIKNLRHLSVPAMQAQFRAHQAAQTLDTLPDPTTARQMLHTAQGLQDKIRTLSDCTKRLQSATQTLQSAQEILSLPVPAMGPINALASRRDALRAILLAYRAANGSMALAAADISHATSALADAQHDYIATLQEAGTCPTCGQRTTDLPTSHAGVHA